MQVSQRYMLTIRDLFTVCSGALCGAEIVIAIFDGDTEIDRLRFEGKVGPGGEGYRRSYTGKPGLTGQIVSGPGDINFLAVASVDLIPAA
jgi:hypothetical protein